MSKKKKIKAVPKEHEFKSVLEEIQSLAKELVEDYVKNPSELSGSLIQFHEKSPLLSKKNKKD
tara:strand:- start:610 stop:798 length:189 start_codon:yes stop_codon:yes gene_type:complete